MPLNRREVLAGLLTSAAARACFGGVDAVLVPGKRPLILHNDRPEDLETPVRYFDSWLTPADTLFVRQHLPRPPAIEAGAYRLTVNGLVSKPLALTLAELERLPQVTVPAVLECAGNGRGFFRPQVPGIQWGRGAIGNVEWSGPRVSDVLALAGADRSAAFLEVDGADTGVGGTPDFIRSLPMKKALDSSTLLAVRMNGNPIPEIHGYPARLIAPGWCGSNFVKWVTRLSPAAESHAGFFMKTAYRFPKTPIPPGGTAPASDLEPIAGMPVKSAITSPEDQASLTAGPQTVRGFAWAGEEMVERVEISVDGGSHWIEATLSPQKLRYAWRLFEYHFFAEPGYYTILSRAIDSSGRVQPIVATWNPSGYLWNAVDRVGVKVEKRA
ncbi:MAG: sulfite oxidase [Acidobacteriia bacterium]|nr:sulfite oxidase [Terriglobia bacterium]MBV8906897.1 sulfite oxidase [Terriglobia bacterium]